MIVAVVCGLILGRLIRRAWIRWVLLVGLLVYVLPVLLRVWL